MSATERLYYADSHLLEFDARVLEAAEVERGRTAVVLDRTAFYPTGGGQPHDTGALGAARVVDCEEREEDGAVVHVCEGEPPAEGARVTGRVDWPRRLDHIQQHTGQHILSQALVSLFDAPTRSFRMTERACEIDVDLREPSDERVERAVDLANRVVWEDRPLRVLSLTAEEAARLPLRRDSAREGELRVVEIEGFDLSPCGGTHALRTGEVGVLVVRSWERAKGLTRIEFAAGTRALADYRLANRAARRVASLFSAARDDAFDFAARALEENKRLSRRLRALEEIAARAEADELSREAVELNDAAQEPKGTTEKFSAATQEFKGVDRNLAGGARVQNRAGGARVIARTFEDRDAESLKRLALALAARPGHVALLGSREGGRALLVFARASDAPGDMNALLRAACATVEGRGGGRPDLAQGGGPRAERLQEALETAARTLAASDQP